MNVRHHGSHVTLTLTRLEARMLTNVVANGWGDGDFASWLGNRADVAACKRAMRKLEASLELAPCIRCGEPKPDGVPCHCFRGES